MQDFIRDNGDKLVWTVALIIGLMVLRWVFVRMVHRRIGNAPIVFKVRKYSSYLTVWLALFAIAWIWLDVLGDIGTFLGLFAAGIAIALSDVLKNFAGWIYILIRRPFRSGDRVQIGDHSGDVIDIRVQRFSMLEIGNWVDADQSTGRIMHVPNGTLFSEPMANFTEGFPYIWHELQVVLTFESDWELAERRLQTVLEKHASHPDDGPRPDIDRAATHYFIRYRHLTPTVYVRLAKHGVQITGRLLVPSRRRRMVDHDVWRDILRFVAEEDTIEFAYPTTRIFRGPEDAGNPIQL